MSLVLLLMQSCMLGAPAYLEGDFAEPPALFRPHRIVHSLALDDAGQANFLEGEMAMGFGGFSVNAPWWEGYLHNTENIRVLDRFSQAARERGLSLWLYDELGYPSGTAGGMTLMNNPEYEVRGLFIRREAEVDGAVTIPLQEGELVAAYVIPETVDGAFTHAPLAFHMENGQIHATVDGPAEVVVVTRARMLEGFQTTQISGPKKAQPYVDLMNPAAVDKFLTVTHDRHTDVMGDDLGHHFFSTFTDEPSSMAQSFPVREFAVFPWSPVLEDLLETRHGVTLESMLPALTSDPGPAGQQARYRYFDGVADLMAESFFGQVQERCHALGMRSGGHLLLEESMMNHVPLYGDIFRCFRNMDVPGIDMLSSTPESMFWHSARMVSSVAALEGNQYTFSEPSAHIERVVHGHETDPPVEVMRGALNRQLLGGINCFHVYYRYDNLNVVEAQALNNYVGRVGYTLHEGVRKARVALVYPIQSMWTRWLAEPTGVDSWFGAVGGPEAARQIEDTFREVSELLYEHRIEFDFVDAQALMDAELRHGKLHHGDMAWDIVILPECDTLPMAAWERIGSLHEAGGTVLALGAAPANTENAFPSQEIVDYVAAHFSQAGGAGSAHLPDWTPEELTARLLDQVDRLDVAEGDAVLRTTHRKQGDTEILFVINDSDQPVETTMTLPLSGKIERLDPLTGEITPLDGPEVQEAFAAYGSMLYRATP